MIFKNWRELATTEGSDGVDRDCTKGGLTLGNLHEAECFIVIRPDGPLSEAWSASLKAMVESSFENALRR